MTAVAQEKDQLTFDVGGDPELLIVSTFKISGTLETRRAELERGQAVHVIIRDQFGVIIAETSAWVSQVAFREHRPEKDPWFVERAHTIKPGID